MGTECGRRCGCIASAAQGGDLKRSSGEGRQAVDATLPEETNPQRSFFASIPGSGSQNLRKERRQGGMFTLCR